MAFTTATVFRIEQGTKQFQGMFSEMWAATLTVDPSSIAAGGEDTATFTIPGVALGDVIIGYSCGVNQTVDADINIFVSAANTITARISNLNAASGLDLATSTWRVVIGRMSF